MDLQTKFNSLLSTTSIRIIEAGSFTISQLSDFNTESTTISDPDQFADYHYVNQNKSSYSLNFELFPTQKWCQKWDAISKIYRLPINSIMFNAIIRTIYLKSFSIIYKLLPINNLNEYVRIKNQQNLLLKIKYDENSFHLTLNVTKTVLELKFIIANIIGHSANKFYLGTHTKILVDSKNLKIYALRDKEIFINFRIKEGSDTQHLDDNVLATISPISPHRTFLCYS